ncbi:dihydroorotate dehydrogenase electron transfer subunit [Lysinibacillus telephonicus]|nr:dihydroorotate dehydrogenase electron transfer subunit [Lysinibacillus telephonicus]
MLYKLNEILFNKQISSRYWHMEVFVGQDVDNVLPGQFFNLLCSNENTFPFLRRPLSVYKINYDKKTIEFLYLVKGDGTKRLTKFKNGDCMDLVGPLGVPFKLNNGARHILLVARGVGIATLTALAQYAVEKGIQCHAILSARTKDDLLAVRLLTSLGVHLHIVTDEEGTSELTHVKEIMQKIHYKFSIQGIYVCGSKRLSKLAKSFVIEQKLEGQIALEEHMACGMGVCFACVCNILNDENIESVRVCKEGPVFDLRKVVL